MSVSADLTIKPGDIHKFHITLEAIMNKQSINYTCEGNILLHIKALADRKCVVINDFIDGNWRSEQQIAVPDLQQKNSLDVTVAFAPLQVVIAIERYGSLVFARKTPLLDVTMINFPPSIVLSSVTSADGKVVVPTPDPPAGKGAGSFWKRLPKIVASQEPTELPANLTGSIETADILHLSGRLSTKRLPSSARLVVLIDGRPSGGKDATAIEADGDGSSFRIVYPPNTLAADGMVAGLAVEHAGQQRILATATIASSFIGGIDRCSDSLVRGWACNKELPALPILVDVFVNDKFAGTTRCDRVRDDLRRLGASFASTGFLFKFPKAIFLPESSDTAISVRIHNSDIELQHSPWWICRKVRLTDALRQPQPTHLDRSAAQ